MLIIESQSQSIIHWWAGNEIQNSIFLINSTFNCWTQDVSQCLCTGGSKWPHHTWVCWILDWFTDGFLFAMSQIMLIVPTPKIRFPTSTEKIWRLQQSNVKKKNNLLVSNSACASICTVMLKHATVRTRGKTHFWLEGDFKSCPSILFFPSMKLY